MTNLIDRYVAAAADSFPGSDNAATAREVRAAVEDMVEAKLAQGISQQDAERAAMEELGDPQVLAEAFRQEPRYLIGPRVFGSWWRAIKIALAVVVPLFVALGVIEFVATGDGSPVGLLGVVIDGAFDGMLQSLFWVTLTFAIIEFTGQSRHLEDESEDSWSIDDLPDVSTGRQITIGEVIISVVALVGATYLALRIRADELGAMGLNQLYDLPPETPVFNPELSSWWGTGFLALLVISLFVSIWSFIRGNWTREVLGINLLDSALWASFFLLLANAGDIINPEIVAASGQTGDWWLTGENSNDVIIGIGLIIVAWDVFESVRGHLQYRRQVSLAGR